MVFVSQDESGANAVSGVMEGVLGNTTQQWQVNALVDSLSEDDEDEGDVTSSILVSGYPSGEHAGPALCGKVVAKGKGKAVQVATVTNPPAPSPTRQRPASPSRCKPGCPRGTPTYEGQPRSLPAQQQ